MPRRSAYGASLLHVVLHFPSVIRVPKLRCHYITKRRFSSIRFKDGLKALSGKVPCEFCQIQPKSKEFKFQFIAPLSLPFEGRWPGERRVGGVKAYQFCGVKSSLSPLSRLRRQLPSKGSLGNDKSQFCVLCASTLNPHGELCVLPKKPCISAFLLIQCRYRREGERKWPSFILNTVRWVPPKPQTR